MICDWCIVCERRTESGNDCWGAMLPLCRCAEPTTPPLTFNPVGGRLVEVRLPDTSGMRYTVEPKPPEPRRKSRSPQIGLGV